MTEHAHESGNTGSVRADHGQGERHQAGAFDIRTFIGTLLGIYGVILVLVALFSSDGRSINLITGICLVVAAIVFVAWARLRPVVVPEHTEGEEEARPAGH
jgi:hypothetical protein